MKLTEPVWAKPHLTTVYILWTQHKTEDFSFNWIISEPKGTQSHMYKYRGGSIPIERSMPDMGFHINGLYCNDKGCLQD